MLDLREQTFGGTFLFAPRYLDRDGLSLHYVDEGAGARVLFVRGDPALGVSLARLHRAALEELPGRGARPHGNGEVRTMANLHGAKSSELPEQGPADAAP